jgi:hypothetical protein
MGNTDIALPADIVGSTKDQTSGILAVSTQQVSRSALENKIKKDRSPRSLTVLPVSTYGYAYSHATKLSSSLVATRWDTI